MSSTVGTHEGAVSAHGRSVERSPPSPLYFRRFAGAIASSVGVVHYYLTHRRAVDTYLKTQERLDKGLRRELGAEHSRFLTDLRRRMHARRRTRNRAA